MRKNVVEKAFGPGLELRLYFIQRIGDTAALSSTSMHGKDGERYEHVYKVIDLVGSSETSIGDAIQTAISRASRTMRHLRWFEVTQLRGHIEEGSVRHYQAMLRVGFTLE